MASEEPTVSPEQAALIAEVEEQETAALGEAVELHLRQRVVQLAIQLRFSQARCTDLENENQSLRNQLEAKNRKAPAKKTAASRKRA